MSGNLKRALAAVLCAATVLSAAACVRVRLANDNVAVKLFKNSEKASFSDAYSELRDDARNNTDTWRQGMVSGNGSQGFVSSGAPFSDSMIFQNISFLMPNNLRLETPDAAGDLEKVRQAIVAGEDVPDAQSYDSLYAFHPGGALRIDTRTEEKQKLKSYLRYTDFENGEVGVYYSDQTGMWERKSFTSFADDAVITAFSSPSGARVNLTLSFDDPGTFANFGNGNEADCRYKTYVSRNGDCIAFLGHYPDYENSDLKNGGWATVTYVLTDGGEKKRVPLQRKFRSEQDVTDELCGIRVENAYGVYLFTVSLRTDDLGAFEDFASNNAHRLVRETRARLREIAEAYSPHGYFDYSAAMKAHTEIYGPQYDAVSLTLGKTDNDETNDALLKQQRGSDRLQPALLLREYCAARYIQLCCAGTSAPRLYGMWTGEFDPGWGAKYTMDANVNLQTAALNTSGIAAAPAGYAAFILRQLPDWVENARKTHGFENAVQAPVNFDGDSAALTESAFDYPFRYYNAGAAWLLRPLYETLQTQGDMEIPIPADCPSEALALLSLTDEPLDEDAVAELKEKGTLDLRTELLLPLLLKSANYWLQLLTPEYYTDADGKICYSAGKTELSPEERYCIIPSYSPENTPANRKYPAGANAAIDIAACEDCVRMLTDVAESADAEIDEDVYWELAAHLPPYLYDDGGALREWAAADFADNNTHRHLSHLYCAWPLNETQDNEKLRDAAAAALKNRKSENNAGHALVHTALIADRLKDRETLTATLLRLEKSDIRYDSLLTNHDTDRGSAYSTDYALGYLGIVNEALIWSEPGEIELLPCVPTSGFQVGSLSGLPTRSRAVVTLMSWDLTSRFVIADVTSEIEQEIHISSPISDEEETLVFAAGETKTVKFDLDPAPGSGSNEVTETGLPEETAADDAAELSAAETEAVED